MGYYDEDAGRVWEQIEVPGASCGGGDPFVFYFSRASRAEGVDRLVVNFEGGASTHPKADGSVITPIDSLTTLRYRLTVPPSYHGGGAIFMDRFENDAFIGAAHWAFIPYCTQDTHVGRATSPYTYDFLGTGVETEVEALLAQGATPEEIEADSPGLDIAAYEETSPGVFDVTELYVNIVHRGRANVEAALAALFARIQALNPTFRDNAQVLVTGESAGSVSALENFQLFGDFLDDSANAVLTLAPMGAFRRMRAWDPDTEELFESPESLESFEATRAAWQLIPPCEIPGGDHVPAPEDRCVDLPDLLDHYRVQRWPGRDIVYAPVMNKEDGWVVGQVDPDRRDEVVPLLCRTYHRYAQELAGRPDTYPYFPWQFEGRIEVGVRVHVPARGTLLTEMVSPAGAGAPSPYNLLGFLNALADRTFAGTPVHVEYVANEVNDLYDPETEVTPRPDHDPECNVAWP